MDIDLTHKLRQKMSGRPRVRGRYNSSDLFFINNGKTTPEEWMNASERTMKEILRMWSGIGMHKQLETLLGSEFSEHKKEVVYKGITLVGKADFLPPTKPDQVWEFKTSARKITSMKPWYSHQVKLYCTMFDKKQGVVFQPVQNQDGIYLKNIGAVDKDDAWFEVEMEKLYQFHLKVEELWKTKELDKA